MIISVLKSFEKNSFFSIFPDISLNAIYLQHWRKSTLPISFQENKGIVLYTFTRKTEVSSCKCLCEKIVTFASEYIIEFNSVYTKTQHVLLPTMIIDFSRFWYSKKPLNEKTLWKVNLNLKQPDMKNYKFCNTPWNMQSLGRITFPNAWEFWVTKSKLQKKFFHLVRDFISGSRVVLNGHQLCHKNKTKKKNDPTWDKRRIQCICIDHFTLYIKHISQTRICFKTKEWLSP